MRYQQLVAIYLFFDLRDSYDSLSLIIHILSIMLFLCTYNVFIMTFILYSLIHRFRGTIFVLCTKLS